MSIVDMKIKILKENCANLEHLIKITSSATPTESKAKLITVSTVSESGAYDEVKFECDRLDTYLLFSNLTDLAKNRLEQLQTKIKELESYV